jgi:hypothetical protein
MATSAGATEPAAQPGPSANAGVASGESEKTATSERPKTAAAGVALAPTTSRDRSALRGRVSGASICSRNGATRLWEPFRSPTAVPTTKPSTAPAISEAMIGVLRKVLVLSSGSFVTELFAKDTLILPLQVREMKNIRDSLSPRIFQRTYVTRTFRASARASAPFTTAYPSSHVAFRAVFGRGLVGLPLNTPRRWR